MVSVATLQHVCKDLALQEITAKVVMQVHAAVAQAAVRRKRGDRPASLVVQCQEPPAHSLLVPVASDDQLREVYAKYGRGFVLTLLAWP